MSDDISRFIRLHISSISALDLLLTLWREPERQWPVDELVRELRASTALVAKHLALFEGQGLALRDGESWSAGPAGPATENMVSEVRRLYRERPVFVTGLIAGRENHLRR